MVDIRVDDHRAPLLELRRVLDLHFSGEVIRSANALATDTNFEDVRGDARFRALIGGR
ncbi:MAG: hypothetical protein WD995_05815 [Gemmatimonadota bacterium]